MDPAPLDDPLPFRTSDHGEPELLAPPALVWEPRRKFRDRVWLHAALFLLTIWTTTRVGTLHYAGFLAPFVTRVPLPGLAEGLWYSITILAILGTHEFGHYLACRYYDVDASLPYFLPMPLVLTGTLGAVIRIREPMRGKRILFDIGIAGPIAGFLVAVPALFIGIAMSNVVKMPVPLPPLTFEMGEPLLFRAFEWLIVGHIPDGYTLNMHPVAFAAWFGLLATALNLFPVGQLDGGHISYAVLGRRSTYVTLGTLGIALGLSYLSTSWRVWTVLMIVMLLVFGPRHPRTEDEHVPLDRTRLLLAAAAVVMFVLCFTPVPISLLDLSRP